MRDWNGAIVIAVVAWIYGFAFAARLSESTAFGVTETPAAECKALDREWVPHVADGVTGYTCEVRR